MNSKIVHLILIVFVITGTVYSQSIDDQEKTLQTFFNAETQEARNIMSAFTYDFLENYANKYVEALTIKEGRKLWLVEEFYKRKADRTASERLYYVFMAVTLLTILITFLTFRIYQMQKNLQKD